MKENDNKQFPPIIDGTYKKDDPHQDIGKSKYKVRRHYTAWVEYEAVSYTHLTLPTNREV